MEFPPYEDIVLSPTFRFIVGPDKREFHVHSALVSHQSPVLDKLVNGDFREAEDKEAVLDKVDEQTFVRFCQFAYTGNYSEPKPQTTDHLLPEVFEYDESWTASQLRERKSTTKKQRQKHRQTSNLFATSDSIDSPCTCTWKPCSKRLEEEDLTRILLAHAQLYVFADCYQIEQLASISFSRLFETLEVLKGATTNTDGMTELVRLCFEEAVPGNLKNMVTTYASYEMKRLWTHPGFRELVGENNELSVALIDAMVPSLEG